MTLFEISECRKVKIAHEFSHLIGTNYPGPDPGSPNGHIGTLSFPTQSPTIAVP